MTVNTTRKESKALAAVTRQNRKMAREIEQLKNARPEKPSGGKGKGSKGKRNSSGGKGCKGGKGNSNFTVTCAHPQCKGEHFLKECPKMQGLASEEFRRQCKQYINPFFEPGRTEKGFGKAVVELSAYAEMPALVDDNEVDIKAETDEWFALDELEVTNAEDNVPGTVVVEPECVSVPWSGTVEALFEQMDLTDAVYYGESGPEVGMVAGEFNGWQFWKSDESAMTVPLPTGIQKPTAVEIAKAKKKKLIWCDPIKQMQQQVYQVHSYASNLSAMFNFKQYEKMWAECTQQEDTNMFCGNSRTLWPALVVGNWQSSELQSDGSTKTTTTYKLVYFGTLSTCYYKVERIFKWADRISRGLH